MNLPPFFALDNAWINYRKGAGVFMQSCHMHDFLELLIILNNPLLCIENTGTILEVKAPAVIIHNRYTMHKATMLEDTLYIRYLINIDEKLLESLEKPSFFENSMTVIQLSDEMCGILRFYAERGLALANYPEERVHLISLIFRELSHYSNDENTRTVKPLRGYISDVMQHIITHAAEPLTLEALASRFFISRAKLVADFRASTGMTVKEYIILVRMNMSRAMLAEGISVGECAAACGYNSESNFIATFKRMYGISPRQFSRIQRQ